jgi:hypothetical protein
VIRLRAHFSRRRDDGIAMLFVIAIGLIVTALIVAMFSSILQTQQTTRQHRNITSAQAAAEAGLDDTVYQLGLTGANGQPNWTNFGPGGSTPWNKGGQVTTFNNNTSYSVWITSKPGTSDYVVWSQGSYGGNTRTIRAVVEQDSPSAFDYSLFASKGIDIHHHGSSYLSPQVWTTGVHSNGYINIDYSAEFTVNTLEAVTTLTLAKGGGSKPDGSIPSTGYNWYDPLNGKCFPGGMGHPAGGDPVSPGTCTSNPKYSGNAVIYGTVNAGSVVINSHGQVLPTSAFLTETGQQVLAQPGNVTAGSATIGGTTYTSTTAPTCSACGKGASATGGQISGSLTVSPGYAPATIPFPTLDYSKYLTQAQTDATASGTTHVFTGSGTFLSYITDPSHGFYRYIDSNHVLQPWCPTWPATTDSSCSKQPDVIYLNGTYDITAGSVTLSYNTIQNLVNSQIHLSGAAPLLLIQGNLISPGGGMTLHAGLIMVGAGNPTDFLTAATATSPVTVNTTEFLSGSATMPAVLAAGGSIDSSDYDTDSNWTSSALYEPLKATPTYIRGLVYSATYDASTGTATPQNQHFHNYDPKNLQKIYGAQVGGTLHDCNNFSFSYDPLIKKAFGFGGGTVKVIDYQELGA